MYDNKLIDWTINKANTEFKDDIAIMIESDRNYLMEDRELRFVNKFVCDKPELIGLARTFIIGECSYDLMQYSWEHMERHAQVDYYCTLLADSKLVYYRTEADKQRFEALQQQFYANLSDKRFMMGRALEWLNEAMEIYKNMMFEDEMSAVRKAAGYIADDLSWAVAACNQTYFKSWRSDEALASLRELPAGFVDCYHEIVNAKTGDALKRLAQQMIAMTRTFVAARKPAKPKDESAHYWLKEWYEEGAYYFRRIYYYCDQNDAMVSFMLSCAMQAEFDDIARGYGIEDLNVLAYFDADDLMGFKARMQAAVARIVKRIADDGYVLDAYADIDAFIRENP